MSRIEQALARAAGALRSTDDEPLSSALPAHSDVNVRPAVPGGLEDYATEAAGPPDPPARVTDSSRAPAGRSGRSTALRGRDLEWHAQLRDDIEHLRQRLNAGTDP